MRIISNMLDTGMLVMLPLQQYFVILIPEWHQARQKATSLKSMISRAQPVGQIRCVCKCLARTSPHSWSSIAAGLWLASDAYVLSGRRERQEIPKSPSLTMHIGVGSSRSAIPGRCAQQCLTKSCCDGWKCEHLAPRIAWRFGTFASCS